MGAWSFEALVVVLKSREDATPQAEAFQREATRCDLDVGRFSPVVRAKEPFVCTGQHD